MASLTITTIDDFRVHVNGLLGILAAKINDDYYPRNVRGEILTFDKWLPVTFDSPRGDATPYIELKNGRFNFVISERGTEMKRIAGDPNRILFLLFEGITFSLASKYESNHRISNQDSRRQLFSKQIQLLAILDPDWASQKISDHQQVLQKYPFDDNALNRADYSKKHGWSAACEKYPLPEAHN